jgi:hypothetical protein
LEVNVACLVKDEADRYWKDALQAWSEFADTIFVLDDLSEDATLDIAKGFPKVENCSPPSGYTEAWGDETKYRKWLYDYAVRNTETGGVVFWLDADMVPLKDPREFFEIDLFDTFGFTLYDLWETEPCFYRTDSFWKGHTNHRIWAIRITEGLESDSEWSGRGIHCGHLPSNYRPTSICYIPEDFSLLHYGYATPADRMDRDARYKSVSHILSDFERAHAQSILDPQPVLEALPFEPAWELTRKTDALVYG